MQVIGKGESCLAQGQHLLAGNFLSGFHGSAVVKLMMQDDGNLVIYDKDGHPTWSSQSDNKGKKPHRLTLQEDGNLVIYDKENKATWSSDTMNHGQAPYRLIMQGDGNLVLYDKEKKAIWASKK